MISRDITSISDINITKPNTYFMKKNSVSKIISFRVNTGISRGGSYQQISKIGTSSRSFDKDAISYSNASVKLNNCNIRQTNSSTKRRQLSKLLNSSSSNVPLSKLDVLKSNLDNQFKIIKASSNIHKITESLPVYPQVFERLSSISYTKSYTDENEPIFSDGGMRHTDTRSKFIKLHDIRQPMNINDMKEKISKIKAKVNSQSKRAKKQLIEANKVYEIEHEVKTFNFIPQQSHTDYENTAIQRTNKIDGETKAKSLTAIYDPLESPRTSKQYLRNHIKIHIKTGKDINNHIAANKSGDQLATDNTDGMIPDDNNLSIPGNVRASLLNDQRVNMQNRDSIKIMRGRDFLNLRENIKENKDLRWLKHVLNVNRMLICDFKAQLCMIRDQLLILQDKLETVRGMLRNQDIRDFVIFF